MIGYVDVVHSRDVKNKFGKVSKAYSFKVKNDENWYNAGFQPPPFKKGDQIEFEAEPNARGYLELQLNTLRVLKTGGEQEVAFGGARRAFTAPAAGKDEYWSRKEERDIETQKRIQLQSSRNSAIATADLLIKHGAIKLPAKEAAKYDAVLALVDELTDRYQNVTNGTDKQEISEKEAEPEQEEGAEDDWG